MVKGLNSLIIFKNALKEEAKSEKENGIYEGVGKVHTPIIPLFPTGGSPFQ